MCLYTYARAIALSPPSHPRACANLARRFVTVPGCQRPLFAAPLPRALALPESRQRHLLQLGQDSRRLGSQRLPGDADQYGLPTLGRQQLGWILWMSSGQGLRLGPDFTPHGALDDRDGDCQPARPTRAMGWLLWSRSSASLLARLGWVFAVHLQGRPWMGACDELLWLAGRVRCFGERAHVEWASLALGLT